MFGKLHLQRLVQYHNNTIGIKLLIQIHSEITGTIKPKEKNQWCNEERDNNGL